MTGRDGQRDRGAAAVELALVLPVLMLLVMGIIHFGMAYNRQISLSGGAREGARWLALHSTDQAGATAKTIYAGPEGPALVAADVVVCAGPAGGTCTVGASCAPGLTVKVLASQPMKLSIPFGPQASITLTGRGVMRCGG